ncbi:hypothetical protein LOD99_2412 [Oopsacas minuta]|uniref:Uncharacterized protein n=1 Tax=Oopsacas minuta TaxID=111878 RepID=A0AAV7K1L7_9METZ|nr:hypothetical protein LOD99_2412 [Oopsacas minuta]
MKTYWSEDRPKDNNDRYKIEKMRYNIASIFKRMKVVVDGLVPSVGEYNLTKSRIDELTNQITNLELTVTQFAQSRRSSEQFQRQRSPRNYEVESPPTYRCRTNSVRATYNETRIRELKAELEASLQREEALQAKIKKMEEGNDKELANMEDQLEQLYKLLDRSNLRADSASNEAFELKMKVAELAEEATTKQHQLSISKRKITELENILADRRGSEIRTQVVQPRKSLESYFSYNKDDSNVYNRNATNNPLTQSLLTQRIESPRRIPLRRERNISTASHTSQRSPVESPREKKQVGFYQDIPMIGNMQTGREYSNFDNIQPHRYMAMA